MKIYTKKGDNGTTQLIGGTRVSKNHQQIEAYGTIDELNAYIGLLRDKTTNINIKKTLIKIQDRLFTIGALLALDQEKTTIKVPEIYEEDVIELEKRIDIMNEDLPKIKSFILPGGHVSISFCHIARCVCRRAERLTTNLSQETHKLPVILKYLNRLSDYLFVLSRYINKETNSEEIPWTPKP